MATKKVLVLSVLSASLLGAAFMTRSSNSGVATAATVKGPVFLLEASADTALQKVFMTLKNRSSLTVSTFVVETQVEDYSGKLENHKFLFKYVDGGKQGYADEPWTGYFIPAKIIVRDITVCKVEGKYANDCQKYVGDGTTEHKGQSAIPIDLRLPQ